MSEPVHDAGSATLDGEEVARFAALASEWWNPDGEFRPLHQLGPARLAFLRDALCRRFDRDARGTRPFVGLSLLDVGCGGGLVSEPMSRLGAAVTGIDPAAECIGAARRHAELQRLAIDYRVARVEDLVAESATFDAVLCLEVVEHVPDPAAFLATCALLVRPGGALLLSTINRTLKSYALAIIGAEYILRWLPVGTHQWQRFVTPAELEGLLGTAGLVPFDSQGLIYDPFADRWSLGSDRGVNYLMAAGRDA